MTKQEHRTLQKYAEEAAWTLKRYEAHEKPSETLLYAQRSIVTQYRVLMSELGYLPSEIDFYCKK